MNLAQSNIPTPAAPINFALPDLKKWEHHTNAERIAEQKALIAETLEELKTVLTEPMSLEQIRELMPDAPRALKDWATVWTMQGHLTRRRLAGRCIYSLGKGAE